MFLGNGSMAFDAAVLPCLVNAIIYMYALCIAGPDSSGVIAGAVVTVLVVAIVVAVVLVVGIIWLIQRNKPEKSGIAHFHTHEPEHLYSHINAQLPSPNGMRDIPGHIEKDDTESVGLSTIREGEKHSEMVPEENPYYPYSLSSTNVHLPDKVTDEHGNV